MSTPPKIALQEVDAAIPDDLEPRILFQPLSYGEAGAAKYIHCWQAMNLAQNARAVARGAALLIAILQHDECEAMTNAPEPIFSDFHRGHLEGLVLASCNMLAAEASRVIEEADTTMQQDQEARMAAA